MKTIKNLLLRSSLLTVPVLFVSGLSVAFAQQQELVGPITTTNGLQQLMCNILGWFFWFIIILSVIMVLLAAFDYVTAGDDTEKTTRGRKRLTYAAVGIIIALLAAGFPQIVSNLFPSNPNAVTFDTSTCSI
jgi:hypothetical protein